VRRVLTKGPSRPLSGRRGAASAFCLSLACLSLLATALLAQKAEKTASERKLVSQVEAQYPPDLKRALIGGVVRLDIVVTPRGTVDYVQIAGGNPILADAAVKAVKQWKYSPGPSTTNIRVNLHFDPTR
jgi:TonB family protein